MYCKYKILRERRYYLWIFTGFLVAMIIIQVGSWINFTEFETASVELNLSLEKVKESVMNMKGTGRFSDFLSSRHTLSFNKHLSHVEEQMIIICQLTAKSDRHFDLMSFLKDVNVCVNHHTYLRQNNSVIIEIGGKNVKPFPPYSNLAADDI